MTIWEPPDDYVAISINPDGSTTFFSPLDPQQWARFKRFGFESWLSPQEASRFDVLPSEAFTGIRAILENGSDARFFPNTVFLEFFHVGLADMAYAERTVAAPDGTPQNGSWMLLDGRPKAEGEDPFADVFGLVGVVDGIITPESYLRNTRYRRWATIDPIPAAFHPVLLARLQALHPSAVRRGGTLALD